VLTLIVAPIVALSVAAFIKFSPWGLAMRAMSENADSARLSGVWVRRTSTVAWTLAGALSAFAAAVSGEPVAGPAAVRFLVVVVSVQSANRSSRSEVATTSPTLSSATCGHAPSATVTSKNVRPSRRRRSLPSRSTASSVGSALPSERDIVWPPCQGWR